MGEEEVDFKVLVKVILKQMFIAIFAKEIIMRPKIVGLESVQDAKIKIILTETVGFVKKKKLILQRMRNLRSNCFILA